MKFLAVIAVAVHALLMGVSWTLNDPETFVFAWACASVAGFLWLTCKEVPTP